jgi:hypothetical protein
MRREKEMHRGEIKLLERKIDDLMGMEREAETFYLDDHEPFIV